MAASLDSTADMRLRRAISNSPANIHREEMQRRLRDARTRSEADKWIELMMYKLWRLADMIAARLEKDRDGCAPADREGEWPDTFCRMIEQCSEARTFAEDLYFDYIQITNNRERR